LEGKFIGEGLYRNNICIPKAVVSFVSIKKETVIELVSLAYVHISFKSRIKLYLKLPHNHSRSK